jgi:cholesterol transport system auxiliary component
MKQKNKLAALALALVALSACGLVPKKEPTSLFEPARPASGSSAQWPNVGWSLVVAKPAASSLIDNDRIAVRPGAGEITVYKASAWTDPAPDLVQNALLRRFEDSGKILTVSRPGAGVRGEYQLQTDLRAFESVYVNGGPQAQVEIYAKLVHTADGEVVAARSFRETEGSSSESVGSVVDAFGVALGRASDQIAGWTLQAGAQHESRKR